MRGGAGALKSAYIFQTILIVESTAGTHRLLGRKHPYIKCYMLLLLHATYLHTCI